MNIPKVDAGTKPKHPGGRPTKYGPHILVQTENYLKNAIPQNMTIPTMEGLALHLDLDDDTLFEWQKIYPEFSETLVRLKRLQKQYLTEIGLFGGKEVNPSIVTLLLKVNHNMVETNHTDITTGGIPLIVLRSNDNKSLPLADESN